MSIRIKLLLLAVIGLCCIGFIGVISLYSEARMERVMDEQVKIAEALRLNLEADMMHDALRADALAALLAAQTQSPGGVKAIREDLAKHAQVFQQSLAALDKLGLDADARRSVTAIRPTLERYIVLAHQVVALSEKDPAAALREFELFKQSFVQIEQEMSAVSDNIEKASQAVSIQADNQTYWSRMMIVLAAIVGLVVLAAASFATGRGLLRQLGGEPKAAADAAQEIAQGNLAIKFNAEGQDGSVMASMRQMQVGLVRIVEHIHQVSSQLGLSANGLIGSSAEASEASVKQSSAVEAIAATMEQLSVTVDQLSEHVERVREMAEQSRGLGTEGAAVIGDSIREMREIGSVINSASDEIRHLNEAYAKVSGIVAVIRQVAEQTNLLALNAAIEAARAGDQGRGFAVVADEVRKLAERTAQSTHEIVTTVEVMRGQAGKAVAVMDNAVERAHAGMGLSARAEESLQAMNAQSEQVMVAVRDIATAMREHSSATSDIARNVESISILSQSGAHSAKGLQQVAVDISGLAKSLEQSVRKFSLRTA